ncbi:zinc ribbon domain-containing protein [Treponema primitia]|uniref:zinc ribbon domain-containing protein n=1 Tax=Treponema primitia TaxID=88058 RepID=UPI0039801F7F
MAEQYTAEQQAAARAAEQQRAAEQPQVAGADGIRCEKCGATLEAGALFCPECGEKFGGEKRECPICKEKTTAEFCPECGNRVIPLVCPQCGTENLYDYCEKCGAVLSPEFEVFLNKKIEEPAAMSAAEEKRIEEVFNQQSASPEFKNFEKKLVERQIFLEERDYFNKREKRIIKVFGALPFKLELPDPTEEAFRIRAYAALEKVVIKRQEELLQEKWERLFPEEKKIPIQQDSVLPVKNQTQVDEENRLAELDRKREEMERKYQLLLSQVDNEIEAFHIAEEKRKEEERLRREERQRLEQEMFMNRLFGTWYHTNYSGMLTIKIQISSKRKADCIYICTHCGGSRIQYDVDFDGNRIKLSAQYRTGSRCTFSEYEHMDYFSGTINNTGTIMNGNLYGGGYLRFCKI